MRQWEGLSAAPVGEKGMAFPHLLTRTSALGSRSCPSPGGALCGAGAPHLPEIQILWKRAMPVFRGISKRRAMLVFYGLSE